MKNNSYYYLPTYLLGMGLGNQSNDPAKEGSPRRRGSNEKKETLACASPGLVGGRGQAYMLPSQTSPPKAGAARPEAPRPAGETAQLWALPVAYLPGGPVLRAARLGGRAYMPAPRPPLAEGGFEALETLCEGLSLCRGLGERYLGASRRAVRRAPLWGGLPRHPFRLRRRGGSPP